MRVCKIALVSLFAPPPPDGARTEEEFPPAATRFHYQSHIASPSLFSISKQLCPLWLLFQVDPIYSKHDASFLIVLPNATTGGAIFVLSPLAFPPSRNPGEAALAYTSLSHSQSVASDTNNETQSKLEQLYLIFHLETLQLSRIYVEFSNFS